MKIRPLRSLLYCARLRMRRALVVGRPSKPPAIDGLEGRPTCRPIVSLAPACGITLAVLAFVALSLSDRLAPPGLLRADEPAAQSKNAAEDEEEPPLNSTPGKSAPGKSAPGKSAPAAKADEEPVASSPEATGDDPPGGPVCDVVYAVDKGGGERSFRAELFPDWLTFPAPKGQSYAFHYFRRGGGQGPGESIAGSQLKRIDYYELRLLRLAAEQLNVSAKVLTEPGAAVDLAALSDEQIAAAEQLLSTALSQHDSAVEQNLRRGPAWATAVRLPLADALLNLRLGRIDRLAKADRAEDARALCDRVFAELREQQGPRFAALQRRYETALLAPAAQAIEQGDLHAARDLLDAFRTRYPREASEATNRIRQRLKQESQGLLKQAEAAADSDRLKALELVELAALAAPELPETEAFRRRLGLAYPILECAYAELPQNISPLGARSPAERHAAALIFESLVRWTNDPRTGPHYAPQLAAAGPSALARGRRFRLPNQPPAKWSDYSEARPFVCTAADVSWTIKLLENKACPGYSAARARLLAGADADSSDAFSAVIRLQRDVWQPLSLMEFPILPQHCFPAGGTQEEWQAFVAAPVGAGPYRLGERADDRVQFVAQPHYRVAGLPKIREINFRTLDPDALVDAIANSQIHLAYGLSARQVDALAAKQKHVRTLRPRSVWFLAPNYRRPALANRELRLALAHAIDRKAILDNVFRPAGHADDHAELNGPFPRDSWAYNSDAPTFDAEQSRAFAANALSELKQIPPLKLVYPAHDPQAELACRQIQSQAAALKIAIEPEAAKPGDFENRIVRVHDFDLAYWRHDYADETYELWPLFDPDPAARDSGGANFMGVSPDASLASFFRELALHKRFSEVQSLMHKIHDHVARTAVVIPLWQLDAYVAVDESLGGITLDANELFNGVEHWELGSR